VVSKAVLFNGALWPSPKRLPFDDGHVQRPAEARLPIRTTRVVRDRQARLHVAARGRKLEAVGVAEAPAHRIKLRQRMDIVTFIEGASCAARRKPGRISTQRSAYEGAYYQQSRHDRVPRPRVAPRSHS